MCTTASSIATLVDECHPKDEIRSGDCVMQQICLGCKIIWLRYGVLAFTVLVSLFFGVPATGLFFIHIKNYMAGKTTAERYGKKRSSSVMSSELDSQDDLIETK
jgi:hypothetical protein